MSKPTSITPTREQAVTAVSPRLVRWFARYLRRYFARSFDAIRTSGQEGLAEIEDRPLVIYTTIRHGGIRSCSCCSVKISCQTGSPWGR